MTGVDAQARDHLRKADPVLKQVIDARPDFRPRAWLDQLPPLDAFGTLVFQVVGQQLSVTATRTILSRLQEHFGGHLPSPQELLAADPQVLRASGMSTRKGATLRALAERFVLRRTIQRVYGLDHSPTEAEILALAEAWRPYRTLAVSYLFASEYET